MVPLNKINDHDKVLLVTTKEEYHKCPEYEICEGCVTEGQNRAIEKYNQVMIDVSDYELDKLAMSFCDKYYEKNSEEYREKLGVIINFIDDLSANLDKFLVLKKRLIEK